MQRIATDALDNRGDKMQATEILYEEHRVILKVLECLNKIVAEAETDGKLNADSANTAIDFFRNFADGCHHAKEEDRLFIVLEQSGIPKQGGPIGVMLTEHDDGRGFVKGMADAVSAAANGDAEALQAFRHNAVNFIHLLTNHIGKEDQVLFPMAGRVLDEQSATHLMTDFRQIEADAGGTRHDKYVAIARNLCDKYGVAFLEDAQIKTIKSEFMADA